jgi:hypothetical protein
MPWGYIVILTKLLHPLRLECGHIVCYDLDGTSKPRQDVFLQEFDGDCFDNLFRGDHFYQFCEVVSGHENPFVLR